MGIVFLLALPLEGWQKLVVGTREEAVRSISIPSLRTSHIHFGSVLRLVSRIFLLLAVQWDIIASLDLVQDQRLVGYVS